MLIAGRTAHRVGLRPWIGGWVMTKNVGRVVSHGVVRAVTKNLSLGLAGVTATGALLFQSWEMFAASMVGYEVPHTFAWYSAGSPGT